MNSSPNTLKRRRPFGHGSESTGALFQHQGAPPAYLPLDLDFSSLPLSHRANLDQAAFFYGLDPFQLHSLVSDYLANNSNPELHHQPPKKPRITTTYPMAPPCSSLDRNDPDRIPQDGLHHGGSSSSFNGSYSLGLDGESRIASGLAGLKVLCHNCMSRCDGQDNYDPLPGSAPYTTYDPGRPYTMEKPPTLGVAPSEEFPTPTKGPVAASFLDDGAQAARYLPTYLPMQPDPQSAVIQPGNGEPLAYSNPPLPDYYNESHLARSIPLGSDAARPAPFMEEQMMGAAVVSSAPFGNTMPVHRASNEPDNGAPQYGVVPAYDGRGEMMAGDGSDHTMMYPRYDVMLSNPMNRPAARRGPFKNNDDREKTAQTRKIGSCVRCRMQRIRCLTNPGEPGGPCLTCQKVASNTKVRRLPCLRYKITDVRLFKPGQVRGFEWTRRWRDSIVDNISNWASDEVKVIHVSEGYTGRSVELRVRQFVPQDGDRLERSWVVNGVKKSVSIPPYAIVDLEAARKSYAEHIDRGIVECLTAVVKPTDDLLWKTYKVAWKMSQDPAATNDERELLLVTLRLWVAVRLTTKSTIIVGPETLGMQRGIMDKTSPNHGSIPLPPVMGAQLDLILIHQIQSGLRRDLLDRLQRMIQTNKQKTWLTSYLVTFILLHNIALITDHDASYARKHGMKARFAREDKVKEYHMGANILLAYFHYCNKGIYPFSNECKEQDLRSLAELDDAMMGFVRETRAYVREHKTQWQRLQQDDSFEDDYFFVSQLFVDNWEPRTTV